MELRVACPENFAHAARAIRSGYSILVERRADHFCSRNTSTQFGGLILLLVQLEKTIPVRADAEVPRQMPRPANKGGYNTDVILSAQALR